MSVNVGVIGSASAHVGVIGSVSVSVSFSARVCVRVIRMTCFHFKFKICFVFAD